MFTIMYVDLTPHIYACKIIIAYPCVMTKRVCMYVCMYACVYVCMYVRTYIHTFETYIHTLHTCIHTCIHTYIRTYVCMYVYDTCMYVSNVRIFQMYAYIVHVCKPMYLYVSMHVFMYVCRRIYVSRTNIAPLTYTYLFQLHV